MRGRLRAFNGLVRARVIRAGALEYIPARQGGNTYANVYSVMLLQITRDYPGLPDVRTLKTSEIEFFYNGLVPELERKENGGKV
jgi:hypothetical protein